jgi:hypothetical protein
MMLPPPFLSLFDASASPFEVVSRRGTRGACRGKVVVILVSWTCQGSEVAVAVRCQANFKYELVVGKKSKKKKNLPSTVRDTDSDTSRVSALLQ